MRNLKLTIEYDGTKFFGWQVQANNQRTVQAEIEKVLFKIFKKKIRIRGSGRTDTGVHAQGQVANFKISTDKDPCEILRALNANLPDDISVTDVEDVKDTFHAQYNAKSKVYRYTILNRLAKPTRERDFCYWYPYPLSVAKMREAAKHLVGRKDFRSFQSSDPLRKDRNTVRTIKRLDIRKKGDWILIEVEANGFLYKMVRNIVGTLLAIGRKYLEPSDLKGILKAKNRTAACDTAKAKGLCLISVSY